MENDKKRFIQSLQLLILKVIIITAVCVLLFELLIGVTSVRDNSMNPSFKDGDLIVYSRIGNTYAQGDVVVLNIDGQNSIRRVVAGPGDIVDIGEEGGLFVNNALQQESNIFEETYRFEEGIEFPVSMGSGEYFVLGDSRETCVDSRIYGTVRDEDILGEVFTVIRRMSF